MTMIHQETLFNGRILDLRLETHKLPNGREARYEMIQHPGGAAALPVEKDGRLLLIRQFRPAACGEILEIPAGRLEPDEDPAECIRRELAEEVGRSPGHIKPLHQVYSTVGFCREILHIFLATELTVTATALEEHEFIEPLLLTTTEAFALVDAGRIIDAKTLIALQAYRRLLAER